MAPANLFLAGSSPRRPDRSVSAEGSARSSISRLSRRARLVLTRARGATISESIKLSRRSSVPIEPLISSCRARSRAHGRSGELLRSASRTFTRERRYPKCRNISRLKSTSGGRRTLCTCTRARVSVRDRKVYRRDCVPVHQERGTASANSQRRGSGATISRHR